MTVTEPKIDQTPVKLPVEEVVVEKTSAVDDDEFEDFPCQGKPLLTKS